MATTATTIWERFSSFPFLPRLVLLIVCPCFLGPLFSSAAVGPGDGVVGGGAGGELFDHITIPFVFLVLVVVLHVSSFWVKTVHAEGCMFFFERVVCYLFFQMIFSEILELLLRAYGDTPFLSNLLYGGVLNRSLVKFTALYMAFDTVWMIHSSWLDAKYTVAPKLLLGACAFALLFCATAVLFRSDDLYSFFFTVVERSAIHNSSTCSSSGSSSSGGSGGSCRGGGYRGDAYMLPLQSVIPNGLNRTIIIPPVGGVVAEPGAGAAEAGGDGGTIVVVNIVWILQHCIAGLLADFAHFLYFWISVLFLSKNPRVATRYR